MQRPYRASIYGLANEQSGSELALRQAIGLLNGFINSSARWQSEAVLRQILQERASVNRAKAFLQK
jgi:hypothetical protein